jgi:hypothetical protein
MQLCYCQHTLPVDVYMIMFLSVLLLSSGSVFHTYTICCTGVLTSVLALARQVLYPWTTTPVLLLFILSFR